MLPWIKPVWAFAKLWWKPILIILGSVFLVWRVHSWIDNYLQDKITDQELITQLTVERDRAIIAREIAEESVEEMERHAERLELLFAATQEQLEAVETQIQKQQEIFERHDFEKLVKAKPGLIKNLADKATQERFNAIETAFNRQ